MILTECESLDSLFEGRGGITPETLPNAGWRGNAIVGIKTGPGPEPGIRINVPIGSGNWSSFSTLSMMLAPYDTNGRDARYFRRIQLGTTNSPWSNMMSWGPLPSLIDGWQRVEIDLLNPGSVSGSPSLSDVRFVLVYIGGETTGEFAIDDIGLDEPAQPPTRHILEVDSTPTATTVTINGQGAYGTPLSIDLDEGTYTVAAAATVTYGGVTYNFSRWSTGQTSNAITIDLYSDIYITAEYTVEQPPPPPLYHDLEVNTLPISVQAHIDDQVGWTPFVLTLVEGTYLVTVPQSIDHADGTYTFRRWADGTTTPSVTVALYDYIYLEAQYTLEQEPPPPPPPDEKKSWIPAAIAAGGIGIGAYLLLKKS